MASLATMGKRWAMAWAALAGAFDADGDDQAEAKDHILGQGDAVVQGKNAVAKNALFKAAKPLSPATWRKRMDEWGRRRATGVAKDGGCEEGLALIAVLAAMSPQAKASVAQGEKESIFNLGEELLDWASRACDLPDQEWAREQTLLHSSYCQALGAGVDTKALREAAMRTSRCAWWEVANEWGLALAQQARASSRLGTPEWGDEDAQSMCDVVSMCVAKAMLGCMGGSELDARDLAAWSQCSRWPWPTRILGGQSVDWARRKWRDSFYSGREAIDHALGQLPKEVTWGDLAMARAGMESSGGWSGKQGAKDAIDRLKSMFQVEREREALGVAIEEVKDDADSGQSALAKAL
jgi:hypothetical protein